MQTTRQAGVAYFIMRRKRLLIAALMHSGISCPESGVFMLCCSYGKPPDAATWAPRARVNSHAAHTADARSSGTLLVRALGFDLHVDSYLWLRINFIDDIENGYFSTFLRGGLLAVFGPRTPPNDASQRELAPRVINAYKWLLFCS